MQAFRSSVDVARFAQGTVQQQKPADERKIPHLRAGFFGVLDQRFDVELTRDVTSLRPNAQFVFLMPVDEYFDYWFRPLPYKSLDFKHETHYGEWVETATVDNFPNNQEYARITEFKYSTCTAISEDRHCVRVSPG